MFEMLTGECINWESQSVSQSVYFNFFSGENQFWKWICFKCLMYKSYANDHRCVSIVIYRVHLHHNRFQKKKKNLMLIQYSSITNIFLNDIQSMCSLNPKRIDQYGTWQLETLFKWLCLSNAISCIHQFVKLELTDRLSVDLRDKMTESEKGRSIYI